MKRIATLYCMCLIITLANAAIPFLPQPGDDESNLAKNCRIPKCPEVHNSNERIALPYPLDCLQYVECRGSQAYVLPCPGDHVFDKNTGKCGPRGKVRCVPCYEEQP